MRLDHVRRARYDLDRDMICSPPPRGRRRSSRGHHSYNGVLSEMACYPTVLMAAQVYQRLSARGAAARLAGAEKSSHMRMPNSNSVTAMIKVFVRAGAGTARRRLRAG